MAFGSTFCQIDFEKLTMIIFERLGGWGLGNSLFQIATTVAIAYDNNTSYAFPNNCAFRHRRFSPNKIFKNELPWIDINDFYNCERWGIGDIMYVPPPKFKGSVIIDGFFQTEKYFKHHREKILNIFSFSEKIKEESAKYSHLFNSDHCALHVRRGDYSTAKEMRIIEKSYYEKAAATFSDEMNFVIFSDDIDWCKSELSFLKNRVFIEEKNDGLELYMMSQFKNIITANSTFSWWGAWLGNDNRVIMPNPTKNWFSDEYNNTRASRANDFKDLICENWIVI